MSTVSPEEKRLRKLVADNVRVLRGKRRLTVEEAAHEAGVERRHWQKVEAAEVSITLRTIGKVSAALEVEPEVLFRAHVHVRETRRGP